MVTLDAVAYARVEAEAREAAGLDVAPTDPSAAETAAKRARALRHALAEYELKTFTVGPNVPLGEVLSG